MKKKEFYNWWIRIIGGALIQNLIKSGYKINCLDLKKPNYQFLKL